MKAVHKKNFISPTKLKVGDIIFSPYFNESWIDIITSIRLIFEDDLISKYKSYEITITLNKKFIAHSDINIQKLND